jgi:hypothetical protein
MINSAPYLLVLCDRRGILCSPSPSPTGHLNCEQIGLLSKITLTNHPEMFRLLEPGEDINDLLKLPPDQVRSSRVISEY